MARANRFIQPGMICHLTHRCHNGSFLFRYGCDRSEYRRRLREMSRLFEVSLLNYSITSNHAHHIAIESWPGGISEMMHRLEGTFAADYNRRRDRKGAFYADRYHCTMIEDGAHLWNCIQYVDLNMVRAGVVSHPADWDWCGYRELVGEKNRCRLLDLTRVVELLGMPDRKTFTEEYRWRIEQEIQNTKLERDKRWTESIAVGSRAFVERVAAAIRRERRRPRIEEVADASWSVWESVSPYRAIAIRIDV